MNFKKILSLILILCLFISVLSACSKSDEAYIYFNITEKPQSLDPQTAETNEELMIVRNIFEGLLRKNENGEIVNGVCETFSKSGLEYSFNLRENAVWSDGTPVTADDFVFAFRRAVTPNVEAPFVNRLLKIKNATAVINGTASPETLGVFAESDSVLKIELCEEDKNFENTLTTSICMPCNEKFFIESSGKYGLCAERILSNGSFRISKWNREDFGIRLYKNEEYKGDFKAHSAAVFISQNTKETIEKGFEKKLYDVAFVDNNDIVKVENTGVNKISFQNICWFLTIGDSYSPRIKSAVVSAVSSEIYKEKLAEGFSVATSIYPASLNVGNAVNGVGIKNYDILKAREIFSNEIKALPDKQFPVSALYFYEDNAILPAVKSILGHLQKNLSAFINIQLPKHPEELNTQLKEKSLQFAFFPVTAKSSNYEEYLLNFDISDTSSVVSAQEFLLSDNSILPIAFENTNICYSKSITNLFCEADNGYIDFCFAIKDE